MSTKENNILRNSKQFSLVKGIGIALGLYTVTNKVLTRSTDDQGISDFITKSEADELLNCNEEDFAKKCAKLVGNDIFHLEFNY